MAIVEVSGLFKSFDGHAALHELGLTIEKGEFVGLLGPNGAGKTTLIHILLGLTRATSGRVKIFGLEMPAERQRFLRTNFLAYVSMPMSLSPRQNLTSRPPVRPESPAKPKRYY
jgi:ABC-2 type transport system ATP-binding protein